MSAPNGSSQPSVPTAVLPQLSTGWVPARDSPKCTTHTGKPIPPEMLFPASPPVQIGSISSAASGLWSTSPRRPGAYIATVLGGGFGGAQATFLIGMLIYTMAGGAIPVPAIYLAALFIVGGIAGAILAPFVLGPVDYCTFVGEKGIAILLLDRRTHRVRRTQVLTFDQAGCLFTAWREQKPGAVAARRQCICEWQNERGKRALRVMGIASPGPDSLSPGDLYPFCQRAEEAWIHYLLASAKQTLNEGRSVRFPLKPAGSLDLTGDTLQIRTRLSKRTVPRNQIDSVAAGERYLEIALRRDTEKAGGISAGPSLVRVSNRNTGNILLLRVLLGETEL